MRRVVTTGVLGVLLLSVLLVGAAPASPALACGCGIVVAPDGTSVDSSNERALVYWNGEKETIELLLDVESDAPDLGIIIPTPLPALVAEGDPRLFDLVESTIAPQRRVETDWWGLGYLLPDPVPTDVTVIDRVQVGGVEATTIAATDSVSLSTWLAANGYSFTEENTKSLLTYVQRGWSFTVLRMVGDEKITGQLDPIRLTFETARLIYPTMIARAQTEPYTLRLYVFDKQRVAAARANSPTQDIEGQSTVLWAGKMTDVRLAALGDYLTAFDIRYEDPKDMRSDVGFVYTVSDDDVKPETVHYAMVTLLKIPVGTLIVGWAALGLAIAAGHIIGRRRAR
jgi:hypothetical protein